MSLLDKSILLQVKSSELKSKVGLNFIFCEGTMSLQNISQTCICFLLVFKLDLRIEVYIADDNFA